MINWILYILFASIPLYLVKFNVFGIPTNILEIEIYLAFIFTVFYHFARKDVRVFLKNIFSNKVFLLLLLFMFSGIVSLVFSPNLYISLGILKGYFFDVLLFVVVLISFFKKELLGNYIKALTLSATVLSLIGVYQLFFYKAGLEDGMRIRSIFSSPNYLSLYVVPILFISLFNFKKSNWKNVYNYLPLLMLMASVLTFSRGGYIGIALGGIFMLFFYFLKNIKRKTAFIVLFTVFVIVSALFSFLIYSKTELAKSRAYSSDNIRIEIWKTSLDILKENWILGVGMGNFKEIFGDRTKAMINYPEFITPHAITPHNILLNIWVQGGIPMLLVFLFVIGYYFHSIFLGLRKDFETNLILGASMVSILGQGIFDSAVWKNDLMLFFWSLIVFSCIINNSKNPSKNN